MTAGIARSRRRAAIACAIDTLPQPFAGRPGRAGESSRGFARSFEVLFVVPQSIAPLRRRDLQGDLLPIAHDGESQGGVPALAQGAAQVGMVGDGLLVD